MTKLSGRPTNIPETEERRGRVESLWELYLVWRSRDALAAERVRVHERPTSRFLMLREIEATALDVLRPFLSEEIPCEFVVALMKSTANATSRFMLANPTQADSYRKLGFEMFWSGLTTMEMSNLEKQIVPKEI